MFFLADLVFLGAGAEAGAATCFGAGLTTSSATGADFLLFVFLATLSRCEGVDAMAAFSALAMACADSNEARWVGAGGNGMNRGLC